MIIHVDEDDYLGQTPQAFGEMTITLYSVVQYMPGQRDPIHRAGYGNAFEEKKMHERAKKGLSHCVAFVIPKCSFSDGPVHCSYFHSTGLVRSRLTTNLLPM